MSYNDNEQVLPNALQTVVIYTVIVGSLLFNIPVFIIVPRLHQKINLSTRYGMLNLAVTDFLLGLGHLIGRTMFIFHPNKFLRTLCQVDGIFSAFLSSMSIFGLVFLNLDKFVSLQFPLRYKIWMTRRKTIGILVGFWLFWSVICAILLGRGMMDVHFAWEAFMCWVGGVEQEHSSMTVVIVCAVLFQAVPICIALVSSIGICRILRRQRKQASSLQEGQQIAQRNERSVIYAIFALNFLYIIMISPFFICYGLLEVVTGVSSSPQVNFAFMWLVSANSVINPLIYIPSLRSYRKELIDGLTMLFKKGGCRK